MPESLINPVLVLDVAQLTDPGGRQSNQDALASAEQDDLACFVVSDGVGGQNGGEVASILVVQAVTDTFLREAAFGPRALQSYIDYASAQVAQRKFEQEQLRHMGATVAAVLIDKKNCSALWAHMGDTRVYLFRGNKLHNVTKDHSLVQQLVDAGYCSADQLRSHPQRNMLSAAIGGESGSVPDVTQFPVALHAGDAFLICTDGFWEWITEAEMEHAAASARSAQEWLATMRVMVERHDSTSLPPRDNYTAFAIYVDETRQ
jgi:serine/threonine protein phosphatase PrpC